MSESGPRNSAEVHKLEQDHKREMDHKHKWSLGEGAITAGQLGRRPAKPSDSGYRKHEVEFQQSKAVKMARKRDVLDADALTDSSAEEDVKDSSAAPEPDAGYTYSYDAPHGPGKGSQILGMALAKAVEKFETKATEKLVKDEYEVVRNHKEEAPIGYIADEDDFELV